MGVNANVWFELTDPMGFAPRALRRATRCEGSLSNSETGGRHAGRTRLRRTRPPEKAAASAAGDRRFSPSGFSGGRCRTAGGTSRPSLVPFAAWSRGRRLSERGPRPRAGLGRGRGIARRKGPIELEIELIGTRFRAFLATLGIHYLGHGSRLRAIMEEASTIGVVECSRHSKRRDRFWDHKRRETFAHPHASPNKARAGRSCLI